MAGTDVADLRMRIQAVEGWQCDSGNRMLPYSYPVVIAGLESRLQSIDTTANVVVTQALVPKLRAVSEGPNAKPSTNSSYQEWLVEWRH